MSGSKKISELTTATVLDGSELIPIVQQGETRQVDASLLGAFAPVLQVNGQTGLVVLALADLSGETIVRNEIVSATFTSVNAAHTSVVDAITSINTVITSVNTAHTSVVDAITSINAVVDSVSVLTSVNAAAITSVQAYLLSQISVATSGGITDAASDGLFYGRKNAAWTALILPYDIGFDFGVSTVPAGEYSKIVATRTFYVLPSCSNSQLTINTSAFPTAIVSIPIMFPTSTTLGVITIGVSGTATWPAITTTSVGIGQTFGVQTSIASDANLKGLTITFAGYVVAG